MPKQVDLTGKKFSDLTVKKFSGFDKNGNKLWVCECICGNTVVVPSSKLNFGKKKNCGCKSVSKKSLINQRFGNLTVKKRIGYWGHNAVWLCLCDCGKEIAEKGPLLRNGSTTSCGCSGGGPSYLSDTFLSLPYRNDKVEPDFRLPSLEEMKVWDRKFLALDLAKKKLKERGKKIK